ncbi:MAG: protease modulator HflC [Pedosphaera sp.]|nr:protease modulator HflC [Pedosphaera sp.]
MKRALLLPLVIAVSLALFASSYCVLETEQVIVTQFGRQVGVPVTSAGLHWKTPFIQTVHRIEKRILEWDGPPADMPTEDKLYIDVDTFARWRITDAQQYFVRLGDERRAHSRLTDILGSETRNSVARHQLVELIRTQRDRKPVVDSGLGQTGINIALPAIRFGRAVLEGEILEAAKPKLAEYGIELLDVRFKRINYNPGVAAKIYSRMVSERQQIASRFRSEGEGQAAEILGTRERDMQQIESEAYRKVQEIQGRADAEATAIYAAAYGKTPEAREFYSFNRTLQTYRSVFDRETTLVLTTDSSLLRLFKHGPAAPAPAPAPR